MAAGGVGVQDWESSLCFCVPLGRQRAVLAYFVLMAVLGNNYPGTQPHQTQAVFCLLVCFFNKYFLMPPYHPEVKLIANKAYPSK